MREFSLEGYYSRRREITLKGGRREEGGLFSSPFIPTHGVILRLGYV